MGKEKRELGIGQSIAEQYCGVCGDGFEEMDIVKIAQGCRITGHLEDEGKRVI